MYKLLILAGVVFIAFFVAVVFVNATPPGGVTWPYFAVMLLIPYASYHHAERLSIAICYGFACGILFAWPVFVDTRTALRAEYGLESQAELFSKIILFAVSIAALCVIGHSVRLFQSKR